jgi:hypothetical protein
MEEIARLNTMIKKRDAKIIRLKMVLNAMYDKPNEDVGMELTAEEIDEQNIAAEERKRERLEEDRSYRADMLDAM